MANESLPASLHLQLQIEFSFFVNLSSPQMNRTKPSPAQPSPAQPTGPYKTTENHQASKKSKPLIMLDEASNPTGSSSLITTNSLLPTHALFSLLSTTSKEGNCSTCGSVN